MSTGPPHALTPTVVNPADPAVLAEPDRIYRELRYARHPARLTDGTWVAYSDAAVRHALRAHGTFSCTETNGSERRRIPVLVGSDPPEHTRLRRSAMQVFSNSARERWQGRVAEQVSDVVDRALRSQRFDAVSRLCAAVPAAVLAELMAIPAARLTQLTAQPPTGANGDRRRMMSHFFAGQVEARRQEPGTDLISSLLHGTKEPMSTDEAVAHCALLLAAGMDAPRDLLANLLVQLDTFPGHLDRVRTDSAFADALAEEGMRYYSPVQAVYRTVRRDVVVDAADARAGDRVLLVIASANRDEAVCDEGDRFLPDRYLAPRRGPPHLGLGLGAHACLGATLARLATVTALHALARSGKRLRVVDTPVRGRTIHFRRVVRLDVVVEA